MGRSAEGARMRGDGPHPKPGRRPEVLAVEGAGITHPARKSAASRTKAVAACVTVRAINSGQPADRASARAK